MKIRSALGKVVSTAIRMLNRGADSREFLLEMMPKGSVCAEIGVWRGDFSQQILEGVRPRRLYLIDPWRFEKAESYRGAWYGGAAAKSQADMDEIHEAVARRFESQVRRGAVEILRCTSTEASERIEDDSLDWVYIDGNHLYEFVRQDLLCFCPKVRSGGFLAGDDYGTKGWWGDGVTRAVDEFVASGACKLVAVRNHQFVLAKP